MSTKRVIRAVVTRRFHAPADRVFDAWLNREMLGRWMFGPAIRDEEIAPSSEHEQRQLVAVRPLAGAPNVVRRPRPPEPRRGSAYAERRQACQRHVSTERHHHRHEG